MHFGMRATCINVPTLALQMLLPNQEALNMNSTTGYALWMERVWRTCPVLTLDQPVIPLMIENLKLWGRRMRTGQREMMMGRVWSTTWCAMKSREKIGLLQQWTGTGALATGAISCTGSAAGRSEMVAGCTSATGGTAATGNVAMVHATASNGTVSQKMYMNLDQSYHLFIKDHMPQNPKLDSYGL